jgi:uncharacterized protein (TIGR03437 family)
MKLQLILALAMCVTPFLCRAQGIISTVAGGGVQLPGDGGPATSASLIQPSGIAVDRQGNIYFVETGSYRVRKVSASGTITTIAGTGMPGIGGLGGGNIGDDGPATSASFFFNQLRAGIAVDSAGNVYVTDTGNYRVRKIDANGIITTVAGTGFPGLPGPSGGAGDGGPATSAALFSPSAVAVDTAGNLYIADTGSARVRKVDTSGIIRTVAGNGNLGFSGDGGPATNASFNAPFALAVDSAGNLYIGDNTQHRVRKVDAAGTISTFAGRGTLGFSGDGGPATNALFTGIQGLAADTAGNLFIVDNGNRRVRKVDPAGIVTTVAGTGGFGDTGDGGAATSATLSSPVDVAVDAAGSLYISDGAGARIRKVSAAPPAAGPAIISTLAGSNNLSLGDGGPATSAQLGNAQGITVDSAGNVYIAEMAFARVRKVDTAGIIRTVAGNGGFGYSGDGGPATAAQLLFPRGVALDADGNLYIADGGNHRVRKVTPAGLISTIAGNGNSFGPAGDGQQATTVSVPNPSDVVVDGAGNVFISVSGRVRRVDRFGVITTVAGGGANRPGDGGPATSATVDGAQSVALDSGGNLYIADATALRVRKVDPAGIISTVAGNGNRGFSGDGGPATAAQFSQVTGVAVDTGGNLYIADGGNRRIRKVDPAGIITTFAGNGSNGVGGDGSAAISAQLTGPADVAVDASGNVYIADGTRVRKVTVASGGPTISANGVVNAASFQPGIAPNSWATILGSNLATTTDNWNNSIVNGRLPATLAGVSVTVGGRPAYLSYVSPTQINLLVPDIAPGPAPVIVTNPGGTSAAFAVTVNQYGPAFFVWPGNQAVATRQDFSFAARAGTFAGLATLPARPGDVIILWGTGFGPTIPATPVGIQVPSDRIYSTSTLPAVTINNVPATVYGAALAPGFAGLYQVAIEVPGSLADGDWPVQAGVGGATSPSGVVLAVRR